MQFFNRKLLGNLRFLFWSAKTLFSRNLSSWAKVWAGLGGLSCNTDGAEDS